MSTQSSEVARNPKIQGEECYKNGDALIDLDRNGNGNGNGDEVVNTPSAALFLELLDAGRIHQMLKRNWSKSLREHVRQIFLQGALLQEDLTGRDLLMDKMILDLDVLGASMKHRILGNGQGRLTVEVETSRRILQNAKVR